MGTKFFLSKEDFLQRTYEIVGAAMEVHKNLGGGFLEKVYERALAVELKSRGISFETQRLLNVYYKGENVGDYAVDILVDNWLILELKAVKELSDVHKSQCLNYLNALNLDVCLLINFGGAKLHYKRFVRKELLPLIDSNAGEPISFSKI